MAALDNQNVMGDEDKAVELLVRWQQSDSDVRQAFGNIDQDDAQRLRKRAREWVRKILKERRESSG